jgi:hypothetical protein
MTVLLTVSVHVVRARVKTRRLEEAHAHVPVFERNEAESGAERLRKIRELAERIEGREKKTVAAPKSQLEPTAPKSTATSSAPALSQLYEQSKRDYLAAREQLLKAEALRLSKITGQSFESARDTVESQHPGVGTGQSGGSSGAGQSDRDMQGAIGRMQADAQAMLGRVMDLQRSNQEGMAISSEDAREAYAAANRSQQLAVEARNFAPVVDWTRLMGRPLSTVAVNGVLDHDAGDFRRVESQRESDLRNNFLSRAQKVRFSRRIGVTGTEHGEWICPDAWYIVGPFDNPQRDAIDKSFPPEIEIDRDAIYVGKNGQPISWEYVRVHQIGVIPPHPEEYAIYYAYTEIYSAQPMDCWLALGSDDHSKLWVNGLLIWSDTRDQKNWSPTEGFRRVRLNAGFNQFRLRLENGWNGTMFSVVILLE